MSMPIRSASCRGPMRNPAPRMAASTCSGSPPASTSRRGFEVEGPGDSVHDEARRVGDLNRCLAQLFRGLYGLVCSRRICRGSGDNLDQAHRWNRVKEVHAHHAFGALCSRGDARDGERGGVRGEHCVVANYAFKVREDLLLDLEILDYGLDDEWYISTRF